ncbi:hypothetical protein Tco_1427884 [Tanacetum coccineum]
MSEPATLIPSPPTSTMRNTAGKGNKQTSKNLNRHTSDAALREYCDKYDHQLLPIIAEKVHHEKVQQEKQKEVKARLNFEGCSGRNSKIQEMIRRDRSESPRYRPEGKRRRDEGVFNRLGENVTMKEHIHGGRKCSLRVKIVEGDTRSQERKNQSQELKRKTYPNHGSKVERWAMPTWCHMFNSTLTGFARDPSGSKEPNGTGYRIPNWFQRRDHMANGTNITASKNRGCGALNLYMDEFYGDKITISVQWDHKKAEGEENLSSPVNSS